jgi:threonine aldolase
LGGARRSQRNRDPGTERRHARRFAIELERRGHTILNEVVLNQVLVSFGEPAFTRAVIERIQRDGVCWCGGTQWQGHAARRISVSSWATTDEDVDLSVAAIVRAADDCRTADG